MKFSFQSSETSFSERFLLSLAVVITLYLLVFVKAPDSNVPERVNIDVWHVTGAEEEGSKIPEWFNASQDRIQIHDVGLPFLEVEQKFLTSVVGNVAPDLFEYFGSVAQWASRGALMPLDEFIERDHFDKSRIFPALWDEVSWDGNIFAVPTGTACDAFYWNKTHFREAGLDPDRPPRTWKELEEYALKLTIRNPDGSIARAGYIPGYWSPLGVPNFAFWSLQKGAKFLSPDGKKINLTSQACIDALEWEGKLFKTLGGEELIKIRSSFGYGTQQGFIAGKLSMIAQKSSLIQELAKFAPQLEYGVSMFPVPEDGHPATLSGAVWIGIPIGARHPEEAWEYIKYVTRTDVQKMAADYLLERNLAAFFSANIEVVENQVQTLPYMKVFMDSMKWAQSPTFIPLAHSVFWREFPIAWDNVIRRKMSAPQALKKAEDVVQIALDNQLDYSEFYREYRKKSL